MILFWMKRNSMMLVITQGSFLRVIGEQHIHRINQAAGCRLFSRHHQANSITLWTQMNDPVSTCDNCSIALHVALQCNFDFAQEQLDRIYYPRCMSSQSMYSWPLGTKKQLVKRIPTFHGTDKSESHGVTIKCTVDRYCLAHMLGFNRERPLVVMYNVLCYDKAISIIINCSSALEKANESGL